MKHLTKLVVVLFLLLSCPLPGLGESAERQSSADILKRNRMIGYMLAKQLPTVHISDKAMDDALARAAFTLYLSQIDFQKRFLLQEDVDQLKAFALYIDDNLVQGNNPLPDVGVDILGGRIDQVEKMVESILVAGVDFRSSEPLETDPKKLDFAKDLQGLQNRWQKILKSEVIAWYLELEDDAEKAKENKTPGTLLQEARLKVAKRYKEIFRRLRQETRQDHYDRYFNAVARAFDPHTNYIPPAGKEQFDINMRGSLEGIGALLREDDGFIKVMRIIPGSASARQGRLQAEDIILQVAQGVEEPVDITDMRLRDAVRLIRGTKGSEVRLTVRKVDGSKDTIPIIRDIVQIEETFVKSMVLKNPGGQKIGLIYLPGFYRDFEKFSNGQNARNSTDDTRREVLALKKQGVDGIILDLRNNGGGALIDAVDIAGLFLPSGPVVQVKNSNGSVRVLNDEDPEMLYGGPLVVLVNVFSASASEIVAAALQDYRRAIIVGGPTTYGKGTVQTIIDLNDNIPLFHANKYDDLGALKVTIQKFYRVTGGSTQYKGVEPDIVLPSVLESLKSEERFLEYSMPWSRIDPVTFTASQVVSPAKTDAIRAASVQRVAKNEKFKAIRDEIARVQEQVNNSLMSLDIKDIKEKRNKARAAKESVGKPFGLFEGKGQTDGNTVEEQEDTQPDADAWLEEVKKDPYIREAELILADMT